MARARETRSPNRTAWRSVSGTSQGQTYAVLERHQRYQLKSGRYQLQKIALYVQSAQPLTERTFVSGIGVIGDASCQLNARSEILRCAVNPNGPCDGCRDYQKC